MNTYRILIEYDGAEFSGWQRQPNQPSAQESLEEALSTILRTRTAVVGSGRTDAGVHARGQVAHFCSEAALDTRKLAQSLNGILPNAIAVRGADLAPRDFHARYDAIKRTYVYQVSCIPVALERGQRWLLRPTPDFDLMNVAAEALIGTHDFDSFCVAKSTTRNRVCSVEHAMWAEERRPGDWRFTVTANRFLHGMVRTIVGTLVELGCGKRPPDDLIRILAERDRKFAGTAAPAHALILERVEYRQSGSDEA